MNSGQEETGAAARLRPVVVVTQARMSSARLPGKVLRTAGGRTLLEWHLLRVMAARSIDRVVLATTALAGDDPIVTLGERLGVMVVRGPEADVLERFRQACLAANAATVVRVTADCPLIDPGLIDATVASFLEGGADYARLDARLLPLGLSVEVVAAHSLLIAAAEARDSDEREHVTPFIWRRPNRFRLREVAAAGGDPSLAQDRWCVDEGADFELISRILEAMAPAYHFAWRDVVALLEKHPDWRLLNKHVQQIHV